MWTSIGRNWGWFIIGFTTLFYFQAGENCQGLSFWQIQALIGLFFAIHLATFLFGDLGYMDSSGSNFGERTRDSGSLWMFSFIHPLLSRVCVFDPSLQWIQLSHWFAIFDYQSVHHCTTQRSGAKPNLRRSESYGYPHQLLLTSEIDRPSQLCHQLW
jgi:hypothetical protein